MDRKPVLVGAAVAALLAAATGYYSGRATAPASTQGALAVPTTKSAVAAFSTKGKISDAPTSASQTAARHSGARRPLTSAVSNPSATAPLPAPGTPLKQTFAELKARADAGDDAAATRLFHDIQNCAEVQRINQTMPGLANRALNSDPTTMSAGAAQRSDRMLGMVQHSLDFANDNAALCADVGPDEMAALVPSTLQAAQAGDPQAADCYVGANLNNWPDVLDNPSWISDYKSNALPVATSAVQQGDWAMVSLLASAYRGGARSNTMLPQVTGTDPTLAYSYAKLASLGQPTGTDPTRTANNLSNLASQLSPDQQQAADAWAQNMYQQSFGSTPRQPGQVANTMRACENGGQ